MKNSTLHLSFESFTLFELHTLIITVQDFHTYANKTSVNVTSIVVANVTGEDIPSDFIFNMDDVNVTSRQVMVNFSSKYQVDQSRSAQVGAGFQMKYEYLNSCKYKRKERSPRCVLLLFFISKITPPKVLRNRTSRLWNIATKSRIPYSYHIISRIFPSRKFVKC